MPMEVEQVSFKETIGKNSETITRLRKSFQLLTAKSIEVNSSSISVEQLAQDVVKFQNDSMSGNNPKLCLETYQSYLARKCALQQAELDKICEKAEHIREMALASKEQLADLISVIQPTEKQIQALTYLSTIRVYTVF